MFDKRNNTRGGWNSLGHGYCGGVSSAQVYWKVTSVQGKLRSGRGQEDSDHHTELKMSASLAKAAEQRWHIRGTHVPGSGEVLVPLPCSASRWAS